MNKPLVSDIYLRDVDPGELQELAGMHLEIWQQAYLAVFSEKELKSLQPEEFSKAWNERTADGGREIKWIMLDGQKVGFLSFVPEGQSRAEITHFYLLPSYWGGGASTAAMKSLLLLLLSQGVQEVNLWVLTENLRARQFYKSCKFKKDGQQRVRYSYGLRLEEILMQYRP